MRFLKTVIPWLFLLIISATCGKSGDTIRVAESLDEAKALAADNSSFIVVDFWRHG
jgi:hypothetical protein